ncbi:hypothetical protein QTI24_13995 [Variovorax sp. J22P240]|uniref:hypothetical protein n=1 Tax=unclassified Variovorax TaxID=663243 RepID=UPI002576A433|nr:MULTISPECIES: hypothetical protein [unclassified Variovorax]MDL9999726.1 hypothetical protein [Variovorax sp. J22P240]MDM0049150.1 hypothetical protein [Variovorax sp. J22R115]
MSDSQTSPESASIPSQAHRSRAPLPPGYREGMITAITVIIGFSLSFVRYWAFEAPGEWTSRSVIALVALLIPIVAEIYTLYRALLVADDDEATYRTTVRWFIGSVCGMLVSVSLAAVVLSGGH